VLLNEILTPLNRSRTIM